MTTTALIAKAALDGVAAGITDAVKDATLSDGVTDYTGRVVFTGATAAGGFPGSTAKDRVNTAILEGFSASAQAGWTIVADTVTYYVLGVRDIVEAGGVVMARVIKEADMLWQSVTLRTRTETSDGAGGFTASWADIATVDGGLVAMSGAERWQSQRVEAVSSWKLVIRGGVSVNATDRAVIDGRDYSITFVNDHEARGDWLVLDLALGVAT